jgi:hypothetical protein
VQRELHRKVCREMGIPEDLTALSRPDEEPPSPAEDAPAVEGVVLQGPVKQALRDDLFVEMSIPHKWLRLDIECEELKLPVKANAAQRAEVLEAHARSMRLAVITKATEWLGSIDESAGGQMWAYPRGMKIRPSDYRDWPTFLTNVRNSRVNRALPDDINLAWDVEQTPDWARPGADNLHIALRNVSPLPRQSDEVESAVFLVRLDVSVPTAAHRPLRLERVEPSYRYNEYLDYPAIGHNGAVQVVQQSADEVHLRTTWAPRYVLPRIVPKDYDGIERRIRALAQPAGLDSARGIVAALEQWLKSLPASVALAKGLASDDTAALDAERASFARDCLAWRKEIDAIRSGLNLLADSRAHWKQRGPQSDARGVPFEAWLAMNEAMADAMQAKTGRDDAEWRLFQLAFVLANICAVATRMPEFRDRYVAERDDTVTLLYFATGGGKSEAFFGLLVFALFADRLRGKLLGITAMLRYPLRLLTVQQAQRAARVLAFAEMVRIRSRYAGQPFAIGFWVGTGGSPNRLNARGVSDVPAAEATPPNLQQELALRDNEPKYKAALAAWNKIPQCPFCKSATGLRLFKQPEHGGTLAHVCTNSRCFSHQGACRPLPFFICDEDIYDFAPAVLLGTVDKLALIGHSAPTIRRVFGMFGLAPWRSTSNGRLRVPGRYDEWKAGPAANGCEPLQPVYKSGTAAFVDPFPSLIVQDEAHLLDESLGTFAGLFESALDATFEMLAQHLGELVARDPFGKRRRAKVIAASATVSEPQRQLEHLYQRHVPAMQFPHPGPSLYESFYAGPQAPIATEAARCGLPEVESRSRWARVYASFLTNGKPHTATSVAVLAGFHFVITKLFTALTGGSQVEQERVRQLLLAYLSEGGLQDLRASALRTASPGDLATLVDLHRIALTYVTNKKGGDQILAAENEETRKRHKSAGFDLPNIDTRLITGSVEQGEIQKVVELAQTRVAPGAEFEPIDRVLRSVVATSAISHGVDVEELNSMVFAGMPSDIAEYIQASSRVGRTHVGFCLLIPTPQRRRDRYIVEVFDIFHRFLERMVSPAAVDRWADRAIERCFPSILQTYLCGVLPYEGWLMAPDADKASVRFNDEIPDVLRAQRRVKGSITAGIRHFAELAIGLRDGYSPEGEDHYRMTLQSRAELIVENLWTDEMVKGGTLKAFFDYQKDPMLKPMTSLRDVDVAGVIQMSPVDARGKGQDSESVASAMKLARHGSAEWDADSEDE